jgi:hypothetical protein
MAEARLVTAADFGDHTRAEMARIALEEVGIECVLMDQNQAGYPTAGLIPVRVCVREEDRDQAREVLRENGLV